MNLNYSNMVNINTVKDKLLRHSYEVFGRSIFTRDKLKQNVFHRQTVMYVLNRLNVFTLDDIGFICTDGKSFNHATVIHNTKIVENEIKLYLSRKVSVEQWKKVVGEILNTEEEKNKKIVDFLNSIPSKMNLTEEERKIYEQIRLKLIL